MLGNFTENAQKEIRLRSLSEITVKKKSETKINSLLKVKIVTTPTKNE
jgi:hypothetical protein